MPLAILAEASAQIGPAVSSPPSPDSWWHFIREIDFWINVILAAVGIVYSIKSFKEAAKAKTAAQRAARNVKVQTVVADLTDVMNKVTNISEELDYFEARDILDDVNKRIRRQLAAFNYHSGQDIKTAAEQLKKRLEEAKTALTQVKPPANDPNSSNRELVAFWALETHFSAIVNCIADLVGLLENLPSDDSV